jgi:hypothetical protein
VLPQRSNSSIQLTALRAAAGRRALGGQAKTSPRETGDWAKVGELIRLLEADGWRLVRTKGNSILKQAGLKRGGADE